MIIMSERALVKIHTPETIPPTYDEIMLESNWGEWTKNNLVYYTEYYGYTLIENYEPTPENG